MRTNQLKKSILEYKSNHKCQRNWKNLKHQSEKPQRQNEQRTTLFQRKMTISMRTVVKTQTLELSLFRNTQFQRIF